MLNLRITDDNFYSKSKALHYQNMIFSLALVVLFIIRLRFKNKPNPEKDLRWQIFQMHSEIRHRLFLISVRSGHNQGDALKRICSYF